MRGKATCFFSFIILGGLIGSCASHYRVTVVYDIVEQLKPGDRVFWEKQVIGSVGNFAKDPKGRAIVPLQIQTEFRQIVTDQSRFLIQADPLLPESQSVKMVQLASGGIPLADGAVVEGSTTFSFMMEKGSHELQSWSKIFQDTLDRLEKEIRRFSEEEWRKDLERQLEGWSRELERSGDEVRRYFQKKILPRLEQAVRDLLRRLKELGKEKDGKSLEEKLEQLKRTLHS